MSLINLQDIIIYRENRLGYGYISNVYKAFNIKKQKKWVAKIIELKKAKKEDLISINREIFI